MNILLIRRDGSEKSKRGVSDKADFAYWLIWGIGPVFDRTAETAARGGIEYVVFSER